MKIVSIILSLFIVKIALAQSANAFSMETQDFSELRKAAFEGKDDCRGSVHANDHFVYYANKKALKVVDINTGKEAVIISTTSPITAIKSDNEKLFILTESNLEVWDLSGQKHLSTLVTHPHFSAPYNFYEQPRGLDVSTDKIYIAHGVYGVIVLNKKTEQFEKTIATQSTVRDLAITQGVAVAVIDNNTQDGFHGFALINLATQQVKKYIKVENVFPESVTIEGDTLLVGYFSTIWKYRTQDVLTQDSPAVLGRTVSFPAGPGTIIGKAYYDNKYMYACYEGVDAQGQNPRSKTVVFDRKSVSLE